MKDATWTNQAIPALTSLNRRDRQGLLDCIEVLTEVPAMYPARQRGRFANLRYFVLNKRWVMYYRPNETEGLLIFPIVPTRARPR